MKRAFVTCSAVLAVLLGGSLLFAGGGDPNYILDVSEASANPGDTGVILAVSLDNSLGGDIQGWSMGVCHASADITITGAQDGADTLALNGGAGAGFSEIGVFGGGATQGVVICFTGCEVLPPLNAPYSIFETIYDVSAAPASFGLAAADLCDTLGMPPVATVVVVGGQSISPVQLGGGINILDPNQLKMDDSNGLLGGTVDTNVSLNSATYPAADAVQVAFTYDPSIISFNAITNVIGAEFLAIPPGLPAGEMIVGLVMDISDPITNQIPAGAESVLFSLTWNGDAVGVSPLTFTDGLGSPAVDNLVITGQDPSRQPTLVDGSVNIVNFNEFVRGDCNDDGGTVNIADGIYLLNNLFQMGPDPVCDDACDSNDDALLDSTDAIYIFNYRFLEGPAPAAPFPTSGLDPTQGDGIGCNGDADDLP